MITVSAEVSFELGIGITDIDAHRAGRRPTGCPTTRSARDRRAREGDLPRLEGARRRRDHARAARPPAAGRRGGGRGRGAVVRRSGRRGLSFRRGGRGATVRRPPQPTLSRHGRASRRLSRSSSAPTARRRSGMSDPAVYNDHREAAEVGRRLKELEAPYKLAQAWRQARADLDAARERRRARRDGPRLRGRRRAARGGAEARRSSSATRPTTRT